MYPTVELALITAGWITWDALFLIYSRTRQSVLLQKIVAEKPLGDQVRVRGSLVPFQGGQVRCSFASIGLF